MSRRTRTAALLSAATLLAGGSFALFLAPAASAAPDDPPPLGQISFSPQAPQAGDTLVVSGVGCFPGTASSAAAPAADGTVTPAADPPLGSVQVSVNGPGSYSSGGTVDADVTGAWSSNSGSVVITLGGAGDYTISASCQLAGVGIYNYQPQSFTIAPTTPPSTPDPTVVVTPASAVTPGSSVSVTGVDFDGATSASVSLAGYTPQSVKVDSDGGFSGVAFVIRADQAGGTLNGAVTTDNGLTENFSVVVTTTPQTDGSADGTVPGGNTSAGTTSGGGTNVGSGSTTTNRGVTTSKPTLPNTGTDTLWPGLVGGALVLAGVGLVWSGRRREQAEPTAV